MSTEWGAGTALDEAPVMLQQWPPVKTNHGEWHRPVGVAYLNEMTSSSCTGKHLPGLMVCMCVYMRVSLLCRCGSVEFNRGVFMINVNVGVKIKKDLYFISFKYREKSNIDYQKWKHLFHFTRGHHPLRYTAGWARTLPWWWREFHWCGWDQAFPGIQLPSEGL